MKNEDETNLELPPNKKRKRMKQKAKSKRLAEIENKTNFSHIISKKVGIHENDGKRRQINPMFQKYKLGLN